MDALASLPDVRAGAETGARERAGPQLPSPLRVLFVAHRFLPELGGTEIHTYEVGRRLAERGHLVSVLATDLSGALPRRELLDGMRVERVRAWPRRRDLYLAPRLIRAIARTSADIVHVQGYHTLVAPLAMMCAGIAGRPYAVTFHSGGHSSRWRRRMRHVQHELLRPLLVRAARLVAVSRYEVSQLAPALRLPPERFEVIPNGAALDGVAPEGTVVEPDLIVSVGRLERYKGHQRAIAAMPHVLRERPRARLLVVGRGEYEPELRRLSARLNCADRVEFVWVPMDRRADFARLLASASVVTTLSEYESQGLGALEAAALGRPLVVAESTALRELVSARIARGVALDAGPEAVAGAILDQLRAPVVPPDISLPSWDDCTDSLLELYRGILAQRPNGARPDA